MKQTYQCKSCGDDFVARVADRNRGWARFCSKSCKASHQEKRTGQYRRYKTQQEASEGVSGFPYYGKEDWA